MEGHYYHCLRRWVKKRTFQMKEKTPVEPGLMRWYCENDQESWWISARNIQEAREMTHYKKPVVIRLSKCLN